MLWGPRATVDERPPRPIHRVVPGHPIYRQGPARFRIRNHERASFSQPVQRGNRARPASVVADDRVPGQDYPGTGGW